MCGGHRYACIHPTCPGPVCPAEFNAVLDDVTISMGRCPAGSPHCVTVDACGVALACECRQPAPCVNPNRQPCDANEPGCLSYEACGRPGACHFEPTDCAGCGEGEVESPVPCQPFEAAQMGTCRWPIGCDEQTFCHRVINGNPGCFAGEEASEAPCEPDETYCNGYVTSGGMIFCRGSAGCTEPGCPPGWLADDATPCGLDEPSCERGCKGTHRIWCRDPGAAPCDASPTCPRGNPSPFPCLVGEVACQRVTTCGRTVFCR